MSQEFEWIDLATFATEEEADALLALLKENNMTYNVAVDQHQMGDSLNLEIQNRGITAVHVQVLPRDKANGDKLVEIMAGKEVQAIEEDDYLSKFSDEELLDVLKKPDEWNRTDYQLALKFLRERGQEITDEHLQALATARITELSQPNPMSSSMITLGYLLCLLGGIVGIMVGIQLYSSNKRLPDGRKTYAYSPQVRSHGARILALGSVMLLVTIWVISQQVR
jgi:hypothetical protein